MASTETTTTRTPSSDDDMGFDVLLEEVKGILNLLYYVYYGHVFEFGKGDFEFV
jgi:hypothetical protein